MIDYDYTKWAVEDREWEDKWEYRRFKEYPDENASESEIEAFINDAKKAEKDIEDELVERGMSEEEAWKLSCQYPLKPEAPIEAVRKFFSYMRSVQESARNGVFI